MNFLLIIGGLILLILGGSWLLKSAVSLSLKLNLPKIIIGMTVVSFATSAPELIVSVNAALNNSTDLALGNVLGSNIANLGLVLGITLLFGRMQVEKSFYKIDWPVMMLASIFLYLFLNSNNSISQTEGFILFAILILFLFYLFKFKKNINTDDISDEEESLSIFKTLIYLVLGGLGLWGGSELLINGATALAKDFGVTERVIGITIVSIGTSIPELAASIIAVIKKEKAISLGNLIGSNIFNILAVLGITSIITPVSVIDSRLLTHDIFWMLGISFLILPLVLIPKKFNLSRKEGIILLAGYIIFIFQTL